MPGKPESTPDINGSRMVPANSPKDRENQLVSLAADLAERQLRDGTASAMVITHYLKLGSSREGLEQEKIRHENELAKAKKELMESQKQIEGLISDALAAMQSYKGVGSMEEEPSYDGYQD